MVKFITGLQAKYNALGTYDSNALYFITDSGRIYKGSELVTSTTVKFVTALPATSEALTDVLYVVMSANPTLHYYDGTKFVQAGGGTAESVKDGVIKFSSFDSTAVATTIGASETASDEKVVTEKAVATYVEGIKKTLEDSVKEVSDDVDLHNGAFKEVKVGESETEGKFSLIFTDFSGTEHKVDLDKEKFISTAVLSEDGTTLTLTLTDNSTVEINLAELVADAMTVKTTEDIVVTVAVGELKSGSTISKGTSVQDLLVAMLSQDKDPSKTNPSIATFTVNNNGSGTEFEAGTSITPKWNATFNAGQYYYLGADGKTKISVKSDADGQLPVEAVSGTGVTATAWEIWQGAVSTGTKIGTAASGTGEAFVLGDSNVTFNAKATYSDGNYALTQLNKLPETEVRIAGSSATKSATISTYRKMFAGGTTESKTDVNSALIRGLSASAKSAKTTFAFNAAVGDTMLLLAIPASLTTADPTFEYFTMSWESFTGFTKLGTISVADARGTVDGVNQGAVDYTVYYYVPASAFEAATQFRAIIK